MAEGTAQLKNWTANPSVSSHMGGFRTLQSAESASGASEVRASWDSSG